MDRTVPSFPVLANINDIATLNVKTMVEKTKRETITTWMKEKQVQTMAFQETKVGACAQQTTDQYTFFFSGQKKTENSHK